MSTLGRSHFIVAADALVRRGVDLDLLQGWVPQDMNSWIVRLCARIVGRKSFVVGLGKRTTPALRGRIVSEPLAEFVNGAWCFTFGRSCLRLRHFGIRLSFWLHGVLTRRHLEEHTIFHVKSGLGRGGAIKDARKLGLKILVDHCTPHPDFMAAICQMVGYREPWTFWSMVLRDCDEADILMVGSDFIRETFVKRGYPVEKVRVVPLGVLSHFYGAKQHYRKGGTLRLIYTGAWVFHKGASFLVDAMGLLMRRGIDCHLSVFGSYNPKDEFVARGMQFPITLHGHVSQDDLRQHLADADLYVFPSLADGFAVSAVEGMAAGLCIVATRESSILIEEGYTGFVVPARSGEALADRIAWLNERRDLLESVGRQAAAMVRERYRWERYAADVELVYKELMATDCG